MTYDEAGPGWSSSGCGTWPGPQAGLDWMKTKLSYAVSRVAPEKVLQGLPTYNYDYSTGQQAWNAVIAGLGGSGGDTTRDRRRARRAGVRAHRCVVVERGREGGAGAGPLTARHCYKPFALQNFSSAAWRFASAARSRFATAAIRALCLRSSASVTRWPG
ncbi:hypothetical protein IP92_01490 [Pseudoduganella flava]|uniref:Uncharacterized protein n=1 Tax=Pseudoduganella flava TaxID=871742 RepID=A0A562Q0P4_9BURK|nr:hypothetical protein IP92_01490 [Pseudoduganella flava]